jgi:alpha-glucosidase
VPIPWSGPEPPFGFSPPGAVAVPWLPQPACWRGQTVEAQTGDSDSTLELYRQALRIRRAHPALGDGILRWLEAPTGALAFARDPGFACVVNLSAEPVPAPARAQLVVSSGPLDRDGRVPADTAAWFEV